MNQNSYNILYRFISVFTEDDILTTAILAEHYDAIITECSVNNTDFLNEFTVMLNLARNIALKSINGKVFRGKCWTEKKAFFPLSKALSEIHKEVFCLCFYRGLSEQEISNMLHLSSEQTKLYLKQALEDISRQSIVKIPDITSL